MIAKNSLPLDVIETMLEDEIIKDKIILVAFSGNESILDYLLNRHPQDILGVEALPEVRSLLATKCQLIGSDFLQIEKPTVSHLHLIVIYPSLNMDTRYIQHAFEIAPPGCKIISLCNYDSYEHSKAWSKQEIRCLVEECGRAQNLGLRVKGAEWGHDITLGLIKLQKPGGGYEHEFEGFFLFEQEEPQENALMPYDAIRDLVNRYIGAVQIIDEQLTAAVKMQNLIKGFFRSDIAMCLDSSEFGKKHNGFKKEIQKSGWNFIFEKLNLTRYATRGLREDINKFVETQTTIPFTMKNIYRMLEIVAGTTTQRMDKALLEVFDKLTAHHHENRYNRPGWKTNSHYLVAKKFILPNMCYQDQRYHKGENTIQCDYHGNWEMVEDLLKALCYISGDDYEAMGTLREWVSYSYKVITDTQVFFHHQVENFRGQAEKAEALDKAGITFTLLNHRPVYGEWFDWAYFRVKAFKKGSMHFEFKGEDLWGRFNQRIARLKGYPLFEGKEQTAYQNRQAGRSTPKE